MKVKVDRELRGGKYLISFTVDDFARDEIAKMASFGTPEIQMKWVTSDGRAFVSMVPIDKITSRYQGVFKSDEEAKAYEQSVLSGLREALKSLRGREDDYSSSDEVEL